MDWEYKREKKASAEDVADIIRDTVSIEDVLSAYRPDLQPRNRRCPCPIHQGKDNNFSFGDRWFKCFVCGESGDVIALVKGICELPTRADAMRKLCEDFRLGVDFHSSISPETTAKVNKAREEAARKKKEHDDWVDRYHAALDEWIELDKIIINIPCDSDENIQKVCKAKEERARVGYQLNCILAQEPR